MKKLLAFLMLPAILLAGCGGPETPPDEDPQDNPFYNYETEQAKPYSVHYIADDFYQTWFDFMQGRQKESETKHNYSVITSIYDAKPMVEKIVDEKDDNYITLIFIGIGPDDYEGGTREAAEANLQKNKDFINSLKDITAPADVLLHVSTGFPKAAEETDEHLIWNHEEFRLFVADLRESTNDRVFVFAANRALVNDEGSIKEEYIDENNILNEAGFSKLTADFLSYLGIIAGRITRDTRE